MKPRYSSEAIVLARKTYGEADRIITLYSKNYGKIHLLAKGVRKPKSRKRGHIEVFSQIKFSASKGKNLDLLSEADVINSFQGTRVNLKKVSVAYFLVEVVSRLTREEEKNAELYQLLLAHLNRLQSLPDDQLKTFRKNFAYKLLVSLGFWPKGKSMIDTDNVLREVIEREISSIRVGKKLLEEKR